MNPFQVAKTSWEPGDTREVEQGRLKREIGVEYDSYRRIYIADGRGGNRRPDRSRRQEYYILECIGSA
jgi:hypothetical protein